MVSRTAKAWWALAREWPHFRTGLADLISEAEFVEMRTHGPKIRVFKKKRRKGMRRTKGHRAVLTRVLITSIVA